MLDYVFQHLFLEPGSGWAMRHVDNEGGNIPTDYSGVISACDASRLR